MGVVAAVPPTPLVLKIAATLQIDKPKRNIFAPRVIGCIMFHTTSKEEKLRLLHASFSMIVTADQTGRV